MSELNKRIITSLILFSILIFASTNFHFFSLLLILLNYQILTEFNYLFKKIFKNKNFKLFIFWIFVLIYLFGFSSIIWFYLSINFESSRYLIIFLILISSATDIGGYFFGKLIGGKTITKISPKKTYSGLCGSFIISIIAGKLFYDKFDDYILLDMNIIIFVLIISSFSQIGDLAISFLKRKARIKDTGSILPGHGGILDRVDGILLAIPVSVIIIYII